MPACSAKKSLSLHSNHGENCVYDSDYETCYRFNKEQSYEGKFFRDSIHGQGTYTWEDVGVYEGGFYSNYKEGYASLSLPDNSNFEGLFIRNEPFGPGILTHANGRQDAGFWMGRKLVRLSRVVDFIIPRLAPTSSGKIKLLQFRRLIPLNETNWDLSADVLKKCGYPFEHFYSPHSSLIYDPRSMFFDMPAFEKTYFMNFKEVFKGITNDEEIISKAGEDNTEEAGMKFNDLKEKAVPGHCLCSQDVFVMKYQEKQDTDDICDRESMQGEHEVGILGHFTKFGGFKQNMDESTPDEEVLSEDYSVFGEAESVDSKSRSPNILSWNRSELCTEMQKQIFRYRAFEDKLTFNLGQLMLGLRTAFRRTGVKEKECLQFLKMCSIGPAHVVKDLLCGHEISEELMDARGNNSLMFAAATDQHEIIDILLDYGVDVNTFNDENLTPLNLCLLRRMAYVKGVSNWETAFLPKEIDVPPSDCPQPLLETQVSILSLDRIFGDGMSLNDSKTDSRYLTAFPSPTFLKESSEVHLQHCPYSDESRDFSGLSQITVLKINKSPESNPLLQYGHDDEPQSHAKRPQSSDASVPRAAAVETQPLPSTFETPRINIHLVPKSNKTEEFVRSLVTSNKDKYLFEFNFEENPKSVESKSLDVTGKRARRGSKQSKEEISEDKEGKKRVRRGSKLSKQEIIQEVEEENDGKKECYGKLGELADFELCKKIANIDKTILKLLRRGADPNVSEVPKPAIHLGVFTKDLNTVYNLLMYGANPNSQLYSNEGLLTPLHTVVLQPSSHEQLDICEVLLNFGADPNKETFPEFSISEAEKTFMDPEQGRNPLQLLCMRPDLEYADPENNLIKIALTLAPDTDRKRLYNGHSYLSLAMIFGNVKLLKALLESHLFDPNDVLGKDRGTALHVLVSTELQKKTDFEDSIKMCDLLLAAGANPLKKFKHPKSLSGTCIDYGYREIEAEKDARKSTGSLKKDAKKTEKVKSSVKDYLQDHEKVLEYLNDRASGTYEKKKTDTRKRKRKDSSQDSLQGELKGGSLEKSVDEAEESQTKKKKDGEKGKDVGKAQGGNGTEDDPELKKGMKDDKLLEKGRRKGGEDESDDREMGKKTKRVKEDKTDDAEVLENKKTRKVKETSDETELKKDKKTKEDRDEKPDEKELGKGKKKANGDGEGEEGGKIKKKEQNSGAKGEEKGHRSIDKKADRTNQRGKSMEREINREQIRLKDKESNLFKLSKGSFKNSMTKQSGPGSETFPEKLRQNILKKYGYCANIDINEFLVPYVVLRDGELYYRFQGNALGQKEQYSLI